MSKKASRGSWASEAPGSRPAASQPLRRRQRQLQQGLPALRAADGHGVHGPLAPRRVRRRSEGARVLRRLHAPVGEVLVVLELVGVVLQDPELRGRLLLHVLGRAVHRLVGPCVVGPGRPLEVVAPLVLLQRLDAPVHHGNGVAVLGPLRPVHGLRGQLPVQRGELVAQVRHDHEVPVVPRQLLCGALGGAAQVDEVGLQPVVGPLGGRLAQRARPGRLHLPAHVGLQRLEGHGLRHVEVALPCKSVQLPRVPHVEVVGQVPQRLHLKNSFVKGACASVTECSEACTHLLVAPKRGYSRFVKNDEA